jgi:carboxymethylenebutenolidase
MSIQKTEIELDVNGKPAKAYLASPSNGGPGVLVLHAWWGLKPFFKQVCDQLAEHGFIALASDYYGGRLANTIDEAQAMLNQRDMELTGDTLKAATSYLATVSGHKPMSVIGFSMGAAWSLAVAAHEPDVAAVVLFYGLNEVDLNQLHAKVLGHFSDIDEWEPLEGARQMEQAMKVAGVDVTLHIYPGVAHWFVETDRPEYDSAAAQLAWQRTFEFLKETLR